MAENGIEDFVIIHLNFISTDRPLLMDGSTISIVQAAPVAFFDVEKSRSRNVVPPGVDITYNCPSPGMFRTGGIAPPPPRVWRYAITSAVEAPSKTGAPVLTIGSAFSSVPPKSGGMALAAVGLPATIGEYSETVGLSPRHVTPFHRNLNRVITFLN